MHVALLHYAAPPVVGGVENVLGQQARLLADAGHTVRILAGRGAQTDPRIPFIYLPLLDSTHPQVLEIKASLDAGYIPAEFAALVDTLSAELAAALQGCQVLIAHNVAALNKNLALTTALHRLSRQPAPRLILWHHDLAATTPRYQAELHPGYPWDVLRTPWAGVTQVVVSQARQTELAGLYGIDLSGIQVVPNGVDLPAFFKLETQTRRWLDELRLIEAAPLLLLPVRITPRKNIELALRALAALRRAHPAATLVVTGPLGPHNPANRRYFERLAALRAELNLGGAAHFLAELTQEYLPDAVIADFYRLADALLLPSREEGFGIPVLEAGLAGLPVFCADIPPLRALGGLLADYFSPDAEPEQVAGLVARRLEASPVYRLRLRVRQGYSWQGIYTRYLQPLLEPERQVQHG